MVLLMRQLAWLLPALGDAWEPEELEKPALPLAVAPAVMLAAGSIPEEAAALAAVVAVRALGKGMLMTAASMACIMVTQARS